MPLDYLLQRHVTGVYLVGIGRASPLGTLHIEDLHQPLVHAPSVGGLEGQGLVEVVPD